MTKKKDNKPKTGPPVVKKNPQSPAKSVASVPEAPKVPEAAPPPVVEPPVIPPVDPIPAIPIPLVEPLNIQEIEDRIRAGVGRMHIAHVMANYMPGYTPVLVEDMTIGVLQYCHVEVAGLRIPSDTSDYFRYAK